jgi:hypothetical protein
MLSISASALARPEVQSRCQTPAAWRQESQMLRHCSCSGELVHIALKQRLIRLALLSVTALVSHVLDSAGSCKVHFTIASNASL